MFFTAKDHNHVFIGVITFVISQFLKDMLFMAIIFAKISYLDLKNHHLFRLLAWFLQLYHQYLQLSFLFQKVYLREG